MSYFKRFLISLFLLFVLGNSFSQTIPPPYINYQAVLYDVNGANPNSPLTNQSFSTFVNINDELGNLLYREEHYASTDANGLITVKMGDGLYTSGPITNFNQINWGVGKYYLVVDFDINGTISSTAPEQLVTVPYSFYAGKAGNGMTSVLDNGDGTLTFTYANGATYTTPTLAGIQGPSGIVGPVGATGAQGLTGPAGTNGLNALIKTTTEPSGANCANGGTKIETGLDINGNGILDVGEVNAGQTTFVCGSQTSSGIGLGFSNMQVFSSSGTFSWTCPVGVTKIMVEVWGAGGGGGNNAGGGGGGYGKETVSVIPNTTYTIIVGAGGSVGSAGTTGGTTSFGSLILASGGAGGNQAGGGALGGTSSAVFNINGGFGLSTSSAGTDFISGGSGANGGAGGYGGCSPKAGTAPGGGGGKFPGSCWGSAGAQGRLVIWY